MCDENNNGVKGKVVFVTGANRGIGKAFVDSFLAHGASTIYAGVRDVEAANIVFKDHLQHHETGGFGGVCAGIVIPIHIDMNDVTTIEKASNDISKYNVIDIVINNAGVLTRTRPLDTNCVEQLHYEMTVNVYGLIHLANYFSPLIVKDGSGIFVQLNSVASLRCVVPEVSTYSASKAASFSITQALKLELKEKYNISVVSIHPGPISTDMIKDINTKGSSMFQDAPPPSIVSECLIDIIKFSKHNAVPLPFMIYPDAKAKGLGKVYQSYAEIVHDQGKTYG